MRAPQSPRLVVLTWPILLGIGLTLAAFVILAWAAPGEVRALTTSPQLELQIIAPAANTAMPAASQAEAAGVLTRGIPTGDPFRESPDVFGGSATPPGEQSAPFLAAGEDLPLSPPMAGSADLAVCMDTDRAWGVVSPGDTVTVTVNGEQMGASLADGIGFFWTPLYQSNGNRANLSSSDVVRFFQEGTQIASITLRDVTATVNPVADVVSGTIHGTGHPISVTVYAPADLPLATTQRIDQNTGGSGEFSADFSSLADLWANASAVVGYVEGGVEVQRRFYGRRLTVMPWPINAVVGFAKPSMAVTVTLLNADLSQKDQMHATADAQTGSYGFDLPTDILPGKIVMVGWADGTVLSRSVITFTLDTDAQNDRLTGMTAVTLPVIQVRGRFDNLTADGRRLAQSNTDASFTGAYTISFSGQADIMGGMWASARIVEADGDELVLWDPATHVEVNQTWNSVSGYGLTPIGAPSVGQVVILALDSTEMGATLNYSTTLDGSSWYEFNQDSHGLPDIVPGDVITVTHSGYGWQGVVPVKQMTLTADPNGGDISGTVVSPTQRVELSAWHWGEWAGPNLGSLFPAGGSVEKLITATSPFSIALNDLDPHNGVGLWAVHRVPGDYAESSGSEVEWIEVNPRGNGVEALLAPPGTAYTVTMFDSGGGWKATLTGESNDPIGNTGWRDFWSEDEYIEIGDFVQVQSASGFSQTVEAVDLRLTADADTDVISGHGPVNSRLYLERDDGSDTDRGWVATNGEGEFTLALADIQSLASDGDLQFGDTIRVYYQDANFNRVREEYAWSYVRVNYSHDWVGANYPLGHSFWITVTDSSSITVKATGAVSSSYGGGWGSDGFETQWDDWSTEQPDIQPGDWVFVRGDDGYYQEIHIGQITGRADAAGDWVSGTVNVPWFTEDLDLAIEVWAPGGPGQKTTVDPNGGSYFWDLSGQYDLLGDQDAAVMYTEPNGNTVIYVAHAPAMRVNYGSDWAECVDYPAGHSVAITLTDSIGTPKATAALTTQSIEWWDGATGFSTDVDDGAHWSPSKPDFQPGDVLYVDVDDGYSNVITIGEVLDDLDVDADTVSGTITANWFSGDLVVSCEVWEENGPNIETSANADGGSFFCDFSTVGWDLQPGQEVAVAYLEPDNDRIYNSFEEPTADMRVEKWVEGGDDVEAPPGGRMVFGIRYWNEGAVAGEAVLSDTMPTGSSYVWDSSGLDAHVSSGVITWNLGTLEANSPQTEFLLVLENTASASDTLTNQVDILTPNDSDWDSNHGEASIHIADVAHDLWINKYVNPGDPAAGQRLRYTIDYGSGRPVSAGPVTLTDILPANTTYVGWESDQDYLWTEVVTTGGQFVLQAPALPGNWGGQVNLWLQLSGGITYGTELVNTAEITAPGVDDDPDNNSVERTNHSSPPRANTRPEKTWGHGSVAPGTEMNLWLRAINDGNIPAHDVVFTDTLPAGVSVITSVVVMPDGSEVPFTPDDTVGSRLVWNLGDIGVAQEQRWLLRLRVDGGTAPGTVLTNCVTMSMSDFEDNPYDGESCTVQTVRAGGANLQVAKTAEWEGPGTIRYEIAARNVGTATVYNPILSDTLPDGVSLSGCQVDFDEEWTSAECVGSTNPYTVAFNRLEPGWTANVWLWVDVDSPTPGDVFTNVVDITIPPGDVWPADNHAENLMGAGPNLGVQKWQSGGPTSPKPGDVITYTLHFINDRYAWGTTGNVILTDTLPTGMDYVHAAQRLCGPDGYFCDRDPDDVLGGHLVWNHDDWDPNSWNDLILTVQVSDTVAGGTVLTNMARIGTDNSDDVQPYWAVNTGSASLIVTGGEQPVYLPILLKVE